MNRRDFLNSLALSAAGVYVSSKTIFLPPSGGWISSGPTEHDLLRALGGVYASGRSTPLIYATSDFANSLMKFDGDRGAATMIWQSYSGRDLDGAAHIYVSDFGTHSLVRSDRVNGFKIHTIS